MVMVTFREISQRDMIYRNAPNLSAHRDSKGQPTAGIMMEIPDYLIGDFKLLQRHGHNLRAEYGDQFKRLIKLCDETKGLKLDVLFPGESAWECVTPELAREIQNSNAAKTTDKLRQRLARSSVDSYFATESISAEGGHSPDNFRIGQPALTGANNTPIDSRSKSPSCSRGRWFHRRGSTHN